MLRGKRCREPGCEQQPSFGSKDEGVALYCGSHSLWGHVDIRHRWIDDAFKCACVENLLSGGLSTSRLIRAIFSDEWQHFNHACGWLPGQGRLRPPGGTSDGPPLEELQAESRIFEPMYMKNYVDKCRSRS